MVITGGGFRQLSYLSLELPGTWDSAASDMGVAGGGTAESFRRAAAAAWRVLLAHAQLPASHQVSWLRVFVLFLRKCYGINDFARMKVFGVDAVTLRVSRMRRVSEERC